jgi:hypothetical protein
MSLCHRLSILAALLLATSVAPPVVFADGAAPPLVWRHPITNRLEKERINQYGVGPYADAQSRLETELQANIPLRRLPQARRMMDGLVKSQKQAEQVFGQGYRVMRLNKKPRDVWDLYLDSADGKLAQSGASLRIRIENGIAQINFKPPGGQRFPSGMAYRTENGINIQVGNNGRISSANLAFFENTRLRDNPLREIPRLFPGMKARDFLNLQLEVKQQRAIYEVQKAEGQSWVKAGEITLDRVVGREPGKGGAQVSFGRVELEGEHLALQLTAAQQQAQAASPWQGPHTARDTTNPAFTESSDVKNINRMAEALAKFLKVTPAGKSKYGESRELLAKKGVTFGNKRSLVQALRGQNQAQTSRRSARARTQAAPQARNPRQADGARPRARARAARGR